MKNDLTCGLVRDLLPGYVEGLTGAETNEAVERHLSACPDCTALRAELAAPVEEPPAGTDREVDYLKGLRRRTRRRVAAAVAGTLLALVLGVGVWARFIGVEADREHMSWSMGYDEEDDTLSLTVFTNWQHWAYRGWQAERRGSELHITARRVYTLMQDDRRMKDTYPLNGVDTVYLAGEVLWQDGVSIHSGTLDAYAARTPYMGSITALSQVAEALHLDYVGLFTNELQSAAEPYRWTIVFEQERLPESLPGLDERMERKAVAILALVENLGEVAWRCTTADGEVVEQVVDVEQADWLLQQYAADYARAEGEDLDLPGVKECGSRLSRFQQLCDVTGALEVW
ncbi:MAG: DUF4825 domain-containing protein [Oscillospiraceae bacterium]|nr:DUF4825 domain-containing protein [Oscillospiraceae bacterium]